jgi:hypothetical protein
MARSLVIFDPAWLYETERADDFSRGLDDWSTHKYIDGIKGHCAYNRDPGPPLVNHPDGNDRKLLHIRRLRNPTFVCDKDGAVWNFPAGTSGTLSIRTRLLPGGVGGRICLLDRWFNPTDEWVKDFAMFSLTFDGDGTTGGGPVLKPGQSYDLVFEWDGLLEGPCRLYVDGSLSILELPLIRQSQNGISYVHIQTIARSEDTSGFLIESVSAKVAR